MKITLEIDSSIAGIAEAEILAAERAVTGGVRDVGDLIKRGWRGQVVASGLGQRLANTIRQNNYPQKGESLAAAALVYARPNRGKSASAAEVVDVFDRGAVIRVRNRRFLAVPLPAAGTKGFMQDRITPAGWERRTGMKLRFVPRRGKPSLLVADTARLDRKSGLATQKRGRRRKRDGIMTGEQTVPIFILVPQVKLRKRLDLDAVARAGEARLAQAVLSRWNTGGSDG